MRNQQTSDVLAEWDYEIIYQESWLTGENYKITKFYQNIWLTGPKADAIM